MARSLEQGYDRFFADINTRIRDLEEKQSLLRDKMLLITESFVKQREKNFDEMQEMKKVLETLKSETGRMREIISRIGEMTSKSARKEELMILQRQFNIFRERGE